MANEGPHTFTDDNLRIAPDQHGVYALYDGSGIIYFGRAMGQGVTIKSRLLSHQRGDEGLCARGATHYWREVCPDPVAREKELLEAFNRQHNRLPRCNAKIA